ncbi:adhesin [Pseudomonas sp. RGM2987]|uniref:adhesin n=1 Tax=Pseudomonas sp. RGM2987 TaxID=2930090 RepID=UPI001FD6D5EB|nr:adhesin [Pseudomonas sp. RGM2987]MCJ8205588.1 adhesin [Pseudomonas sp. RGM2987]
MFKQLASAIALGVTALGSSLALGADDARSPIHISANIPTQQFHVQPRDPEFGKNEVMHYDPIKDNLGYLRQTFDVKNTEGSIHAYIEGGRAMLTSANNVIFLNVKFNNVRLDGIPREVVDDLSSTPGTQVEMRIRADSMPVDRSPGFYTGDFTVIYDAVPRISA